METLEEGSYGMDCIVVSVMDHYVAYDTNGNFICSGDTKNQTIKDAEEILAER